MNAEMILANMENLFSEMTFDGAGYYKIPPEMRPTQKNISSETAVDLIFTSLNLVTEQMFNLLNNLMDNDPDYEEHVKTLLSKWEKENPHADKRVFYYLKFRLEARMDWIKFKTPE